LQAFILASFDQLAKGKVKKKFCLVQSKQKKYI